MTEKNDWRKEERGGSLIFIVNSRALVSVVDKSDLGMQAHSLSKVAPQVDCVVKKAFDTFDLHLPV